MQTTTRLKSYTTTLLADFSQQPALRGIAAIAVTMLIVSAVGLSQVLRERRAAAAATPLPAIYIVQTARPAQPTATPERAPEVRELEDGTILGYDSSRGWYVVRSPQAQPAAADAPAPAAQDTYEVSNASQAAPAAPEAAPPADAATPEIGSADWYDPRSLPTADPAIVAACQSEAGRASPWCGGTP